MRRDGDVLAERLAGARREILLCAPFMKTAVVQKLLAIVDQRVAVDIITRWRPEEVAAGVSDLAVFDLVQSRPNTTMQLLNNLHAKIYRADGVFLAGSANLTATALGWCDSPNIELLTDIASDDPALADCLTALTASRPATETERNAVQAKADQLTCVTMPEAADVHENIAAVWMPRLAAPEKLYAVYASLARDRLTSTVLEAAAHDLTSLAVSPDLSEAAFKEAVRAKFSGMPAISAILAAAKEDLTDNDAEAIIERYAPDGRIQPRIQWQIVREWIIYFLSHQYEIAAQNYIMRPKTTTTRL